MGTSLWDALYNQTPPASVTSNAKTIQGMPTWYQDYQKALLKYTAESLPTNPVTYGGNRLADMTDPATAKAVEGTMGADQGAAFDAVRGQQGAWKPGMNQAGALTGAAAGRAYEGIDNYMNPYISNVTDRLGVLAGRNLRENLIPAIGDTFISAGQPIASRQGEFTSRALRDTQESLLGEQGKLLASGYTGALGAAQTDMSRMLDAGAQYGNLAGLSQSMGYKDAAALQGIGQDIYGQGQKSADIGYDQFVQQRDWNLRNIGALNASLKGMEVPMSTSTYASRPISNEYGASPLGLLASTANTAGAMQI
jgi:hypothetical protein